MGRACGLSINVPSMADLQEVDDKLSAVDSIDDAILSDADSEKFGSDEFFGSKRTGLTFRSSGY